MPFLVVGGVWARSPSSKRWQVYKTWWTCTVPAVVLATCTVPPLRFALSMWLLMKCFYTDCGIQTCCEWIHLSSWCLCGLWIKVEDRRVCGCVVREEPASFCHNILRGRFLGTPQLRTNSVHCAIYLHEFIQFLIMLHYSTMSCNTSTWL